MGKTKNKMSGTHKKLTLREECEKYGIEYNEPSFEYFWVLDIDGSLYPFSWYYLKNDLVDKPDFVQSMNMLNEYFNTEKRVDQFKCFALIQKFKKLEKQYSIKRYTQEEHDEYINNYNKKKAKELRNAKAKEKKLLNELEK